MGEIGCYSRGIDDIIKGKLINQRAGLHEKGQGLLTVRSAQSFVQSLCQCYSLAQCRQKLLGHLDGSQTKFK